MKYASCVLVPVLGAALLLAISAPVAGNGQEVKLKVVTEVANIRSQPDIGSPIIYQAEINSFLDYVGRSGDWFKIRFRKEDGEVLEGFVHESLVVELIADPSEIKSEQTETETPPVEKKVPPKIKIITPDESQPEPEYVPHETTIKPAPFLLSLKGGFHYSDSGDLTTGAAGLSSFYQDRYNAANPIPPDPHHVNYLFGADMSFPLSPRIYLGIGADYYSGETGSELIFGPQENPVAVTTRPGLKAFPVRFTADFFLIPALYLRAGVEYYFASCSYYYRVSRGEFWQEWEGQAEAQAPGLLGGLGFTRSLNSFMDIFVEAVGRYARIKGFKGTGTFRDAAGFTSEETGYLYFYQAETGPEKSYDLLFIRDRKPSEGGVKNPQKAVVDFTGFSVVFGLKFRF